MEYQDIVSNVKNGVIQTPAYIFDLDILRRKVAMICELLGDRAKMCYAVKANPFVLNAMDDLVPKYEVCSPGELEICKNCAIPMDKVVFSGINKTADSVRVAANYRVGVMTAESVHQFELISECATNLRQVIPVILRLTNGSQFGMNEEDIEQIIARRQLNPYVHILGIQYFTGTQKKKVAHTIEELEYVFGFCDKLKEIYDFQPEQMEYGTGLWVPYFTNDSFDNEFADLTRIRDYLEEKKYPCQIILEMGRYPVASCGYFATRAEDVKFNKEAGYCIIDGGIHHINYYGQNMAMKTPRIEHVPMHRIKDEPPKTYMLCGSLCTFNDVVARNFPVQDLRIGDYFLFHNIGAYSVTEGGYLFLSRDLPNIYFADHKKGIRLVRKGIPSHLLNTPELGSPRLDSPKASVHMQEQRSSDSVFQNGAHADTVFDDSVLGDSVLTDSMLKDSVLADSVFASLQKQEAPAPSPTVLEELKKDNEAPRLTVPGRPDDGINVIPLTRQSRTPSVSSRQPVTRSAGSGSSSGSSSAGRTSASERTAAPAARPAAHTPKRFVPETDVLKESGPRHTASAAARTSAPSPRDKERNAQGTDRPSASNRRPRPEAAGRSGSSRNGGNGGNGGRNGGNGTNGSGGASRPPRRRKNQTLPFIIGAAAFIAVICLAVGLYFGRRVIGTLNVEAGASITTADLMRYNGDKAKNTQPLNIDTSVPGDYEVEIRLSPFTYHSTIHVQDTTKPAATTKAVTTAYGEAVEPMDFIDQLQDATEVTAAFASEPDLYTDGDQQVEIILTDAAGNSATVTATLTVSGARPSVEIGTGEEIPAASAFLSDEYLSVLEGQGITADAVSFSAEPEVDTSVPGEYPVTIQAGDQTLSSTLVVKDTAAPEVFADDIHVTVGGTVSYKKAIRAYDNLDTEDQLTVEADNSQVDLNTVGDYTYTATVTDSSGNAATATGTVYVLEADAEVADIDEVNAMADEILAEIITDDMTEMEKLRAIYNWIRQNTSYTSHAQEEDYTLGAYQGFTQHSGDCFTYAAQAKFLLTRAGIANIDVAKVVPEGSTDIPTHFWSLVNIGEGWYHFDCTPRKDGSTFFYLTDAELEAYSSTHNGTHVYDKSLYPEVE